ncbi:transmembrane prolyl 4-hydroxylase-like [Acropora muricata]|uniref:transmembrane prolyl 4-hydroxylase-like n=1 Tax=Acropora muricata TaxID=159855 RepID=UPI0034E5E590
MSLRIQLFFVCCFILKCQLRKSNGLDIQPSEGETCSASSEGQKEDEKIPCFKKGLYSPEEVRLPRREAISLGHVETVHIDEKKTLKLVTRSLKPPIFEIADFLNNEDCNHLISLAKRNGLEKSIVGSDRARVTREGFNKTLTEKQTQVLCRRIMRFDSNKDGNVSLHEFSGYAYRMTRALADINDLRKVYAALLPEGTSVFNLENCYTKLNRTNFVEFQYQLYSMEPLSQFKIRHSEHSWVDLEEDKDPVLKRMKRTIAAVSQISVSRIEHSESMQVANYQRDGHYHAHYDSTVGENMGEKRCCRKYEDKEDSSCLLCRYITILIYLNDVAKGGETVFPIADREDELNPKTHNRNPAEDCSNGSLVIKPVKGSALMWYNNFLDEETGKMGEIDKRSLHAACDVAEGEKWVANMWINAPRADETT